MKLMEAPVTSLPLSRTTPAVEPLPIVRSRLADYLVLVKARLSLMVLFTVAVGFILGAGGTPDWLLLVHTLVGTGLVAAGASALNQLLERDADALMERTQDRPVPAGRIDRSEALRFGVLTSVAGFLYLAILVNPLTSFLAVVTLASYLFAYTPLKRVTAWNTLVGAIPGALPPVMGWAAATGGIDAGAASLFLIVFLWQFPHFWAIAWLYREDYARAGMKMVPILDREEGRMTGRLMVHHCLLLLIAGVVPYLAGMAGQVYFLGATVLGLAFLGFAFRFLLDSSDVRARHVLWASLVYLPVLFTLLLIPVVAPAG